MKLQELRASLPATREAVYMNTGWEGPMPSPVFQRIQETLEHAARFGPASPKGLAFTRDIAEEARQALAGLIGAEAEDVCLTHSTTEGVHIVVYGLAWKPGDELVICDLEHPALTTPAEVLGQRYDVGVRRASVSSGASQGEILRAVKAELSPRTRLVALSHIQYTCGLRMPIREIAREAHALDVPILVDGAQSVGHIRVDVRDLDCDFYALSGQKWLLGPGGTGALFIRRDRRALLEPVFSTNALESRREWVRPYLARFSLASQNPALIAGLAQAVRLAAEAGIAAIEERSTHLGRLLGKRVGAIPGCTLLSCEAAESACGLVTVGIDGWPPTEAVAALAERFRIIGRSVRHPDGVRFSTAYFNTEDEVGQVAQALAQMAAERHTE